MYSASASVTLAASQASDSPVIHFLEDQVDLAAGDGIYYAGDCHHGYRNPGRGTRVYYLAMDIPARSGPTVVSWP